MYTLGQVFMAQKKQIPVKEVFIHPNFHTDEGCTHWLSRSKSFREKVEKVFPGISQAKRSFWALGQSLPVMEKPDTISFGCRGGRADEHNRRGEAFQQTCSAKMFAEITGLLTNDESLNTVLAKVLREDRKGAFCPESIHAVLKQIHRMQNPPPPEEILEWMDLAFEAEYQTFKSDENIRMRNKVLTIKHAKEMIEKLFGKQKANEWEDLPKRAMRNFGERKERMLRRLSEDRAKGTQSEFWSTFGYRSIVNSPKGEYLSTESFFPMVVIETKSFEAMQAAIDLGAAVVIVKRPDGNVAIFSNRKLKIDLTNVALALRSEELDLMWENGIAKMKSGMFTPHQLRSRGHVITWPPMTPYWFLHDVPRKDANQLYNGTESASMVLPTQIPLAKIVKIVRIVLGRKFHPHFYKECMNGACAGEKCFFFRWDLFQCAQARGEV